MSKNAILYNPRTLLGGDAISMLVRHTLFVIAGTHAVSLLYEMQLLYVNAKVEIISELNKYL